MNPNEIDISALRSALDWWNVLEYLTTAIVFIGAIGESIAELSSLPFLTVEKNKRRLAVTSACLLIIGLGGELLSVFRTSQLSGQLIAQLMQESTAAEQDAARLNKEAEDERLARTKIEQQLAWRQLNSSQQEDLTNKLRPFQKTAIDIFIYGNSPEIAQIASSLVSTLQRAGWNARVWTVGLTNAAVNGILVGSRPGSSKTTEDATLSLVSALQSEGLSSSIWNTFDKNAPYGAVVGPPWDPNKGSPIRMFIGSKP